MTTFIAPRRRRSWIHLLILVPLAFAASTSSSPPTAWQSRGVGGGGAVFSPSFSPHAVNEMYVACDMSELFHTTDLGRTWTTLDFRRIQSFHGARVQFTSNPAVLYVIDYTSIGGTDWSRPSRSNDGGQTFSVLPGDPTGGFASLLFADPTTTSRVLLTDYSKLYFSDDGGATFSLKYTAIDNGSGLHIGGVLWDGNNIYIGANDGLLVSNNGGASFAVAPVTGIPAGRRIVGFAGAKQGATTRLVAVTATSVYSGIQAWDHWSYAGVYTLDFGGSWVARPSGIRTGDHPWFAAMTPGDVNTVYLGGGSDLNVPTIYRSLDGGANWLSTFVTGNNLNVATGWSGDQGDRQWSYGEVALGLAVSPIDRDRVTFTDYGFVHVTTDGGLNWQQAYVSPTDQNPAGSTTPKQRSYHGIGIENTTSWCLAWADASNLFACFSDIQGIRSTDGGQSWSFDYTGHNQNSMYRVVRHPNGTLYGATSSVHDMYQSTYLTDSRIDSGTGRVLFSTDRGRTWQLLHDFGHPVVWVAIDPARPNRLYASVVHSTQGDIYRSDNIQNGSGSTWMRLSSPPRTEGHPFNIAVLPDGALLASYSGRRAGNPVNFTASSGVFLSTDDGLTWQDRSAPGMRYWTKDVVLSPAYPSGDTWYAGVFSGWGGAANNLGGLYVTRNRGLNWTRILSNEGVTSINFDPTNPREAYVTTQVQGLWHADDISVAAPSFVQTSYPFRQPERVFFNPYDPAEVWVTSFGNGLRVGRSVAPACNAVTRYRLLNPYTGDHHYTTSRLEYDTLQTIGWVGEGGTYSVCSTPGIVGGITAIPYYRLYNSYTGWHHWVTDPNEYSTLATIGWTQEGVDGYIFNFPTTGTVGLYRLYNPGNGFHHWTTDLHEYNLLASFGWQREGVVGYVIDGPSNLAPPLQTEEQGRAWLALEHPEADVVEGNTALSGSERRR